MIDLIDKDKLCRAMYREAFTVDTPDQRWDSGCWIRFRLFERVVESMPVVSLPLDWPGEERSEEE